MPKIASEKLAEGGFTALIRIAIPGGLEQRDVCLMGYATKEECLAKLMAMYANEPTAQFHLTPLDAATIEGQKLRHNDIQPWRPKRHERRQG